MKDDTMGRGAHPVAPRIFRATETSDGGPSTISSCTREDSDSLGLGHVVGGRSDGGFIGGPENRHPAADIWEGKM